MLPTRTRRPRPPGIRRAPLRTLDGEAPPLPIKVPLIDTDLKGKQKATTSPPACKDIKLASDNYTASPRRPPMRNRPLSMQSEASSLASPPPPYAHGGMLLPSPDHKTSPMAIPPPPPDAFESGPSSVRTSMMEVENILDEEDDEPGNTLTLRGVQKLIRQHDLDNMAQDLSSRLQPFTVSPDAKLPAMLNMHSPSRSTRFRADGSPRLRTVPSDPTLSFSFSRPRVQNRISSSGERALRLAAVRAEDDEARIAALEEQLAEARESEEAQRKSAARLRRDVTSLRRQLEHAEEAVAERSAEQSFAEKPVPQPESVNQWRLAAASSIRPRGSYGPPVDDEDETRHGWGATAFPEFPVGDADNFEASEVTSESTTRPVTRDTSPLSDAGRDASVDDVSGKLQDESSDDAAPAVATISIQAKSRPHISASTFVSPAKRVESTQQGTPKLMIDGVCCPDSPTMPILRHMASQASMQSRKSISSSRSYSRLSRASFARRRMGPYPPRDKSPSTGSAHSGHQRSTSGDSIDADLTKETAASPQSGISGLGSRMDSVRSFLSDYVGINGRSLGSELGSNFRPSPAKPATPGDTTGVSMSALPSEVSAALNTLARAFAEHTPVATPSRTRQRSSSTVSFHLRGPLARSSSASAYDNVLDAPRHIRFADNWSPESKPTPTPSPRVVPNAGHNFDTWSSTSDESVSLAPILARLSMPGSGPAQTPSPHVTTHLAPRYDPWDEYSDRPTPSPRLRNLRPLLLCSRPAMHARTSSLAIARKRQSQGLAFTGLSPARVPSQPRVVAIGKRRKPNVPTTIPGRILHDFICWVLLALEYFEWFVILFYRLALDIRAGPGNDAILGPRRRIHAKRFYV